MVLVHRLAPRDLRPVPPFAVVAALALLIAIGRLGGPIASIATMFAPFACSICHGCPVGAHHDVCDCTACGDVVAGRSTGAPSLHDPQHAGATGDVGGDGDPLLVAPPLPAVRRPEGSHVLASAHEPPLASRWPVAPDPPPPRRARA